MEVEKRSSKGGFLQLFDWNVKSRKKLFSNKQDVAESSKHGKENLDNLAISRLHQMKLEENLHGPSLTGSDWDSSNEDCGTKAPGVVARLMGLDSLPTLVPSDPPFIDSHSFRHSLHPSIFETEHHFAGMRNKLDGFSRNPVEDRLQKLQNRPIERFQSEVLPPKSAKSVPITHHRMLSPIKSPGFILSRNAAYIMEAASKMIEQSPQSTLNGRIPSSSVPLRIRDLKDKMEAAQKISRFSETSQIPKSQTAASSSKLQPREKRRCMSEVVILKQNVSGNSKQKNKSVAVSTPVKTNIQKSEETTSRNIRKQKDDDVKSDKKQRNTPKRLQNRTSSRTSEVLKQNNQKQNCASHKDRLILKPRVPYQNDRKARKTFENSTGKEFSSIKTKNFSGKKRPTEVMKEKERSVVKCNITIDGSSSNWESVDMKNGMDVVSFTFTSPIKKSLSESEPSGRNRGVCLNFEDNQGNSEVRTPMIDSDALSILLEQKLKELSQHIDDSEYNKSFQKDKSVIQYDSDVSSGDQMLRKVKLQWQGTECNSNSETDEIKHPPSFSEDSCTTTLTSNGNKQCTSTKSMELWAEEIELQDSATSLPNPIFEFTSQWESNYIQQLLTHTDLSLHNLFDQKIINTNLFDHLESQNKNFDPFLNPQRKALFDCVSACLEARRNRGLSGSFQEWVKWSTMFQKKDLLADEIEKEIFGWTNMEDLMVDEVVDKDMSTRDGKWLDFEAEALEEGEVIGNDLILSDLIDEMVADLLCL